MISQRSIASVLGAMALAVTMGGTATAAEAPASAPQAQAPFTFGASAWGSTVKVADPVLTSGKSAFVGLGCTQKDNISRSNDMAGVQVPGLADIGAVTSMVSTDRSPGPTYTSAGNSTVASASLLEGQVEVGAIDITATAANGAGGYSADVESSVASLTIDDVAIEITGEEQLIEVPGLRIVLNKEKTRALNRQAKAKGTAVTVRVLETGAVIKLGEARASIDGRNVNAFFGGGAYGTTVEAVDTLTSGKSANQPMPCRGTEGMDLTNEVLSVDLGGLGTADNVVSTVNASQGPLPEAHAMNEISEANLVGDLLRLEGITAAVNVFADADGNVTYNTDGTTLGSITLAGIDVEVPPPGGTVELPGVGTLTFFEETELKGGKGVEVIAVRVTLTDGTEIVLSRAAAVIK